MSLHAIAPMLVDRDEVVFLQALELLRASDDPELWQSLLATFEPAAWPRQPPQPRWFKALPLREDRDRRASWLLLHAPALPEAIRESLRTLHLRGFPGFDEARYEHVLRPVSLEGLRRLPTVQRIELSYIDAPDISAVACCTDLRELQVFRCRLPDGLQALAGHAQLADLSLSTLTEMRPLPRLPALETLDMLGLPPSTLGEADPHTLVLRHPPTEDLSALRGKHPHRLQHSMSKYSDLRALPEGLPLRILGLPDGWIRSLRGIEALQRLEWLSLQGNRVPLDIAPLSALPALRGVDLRRCEGVTDLSPLRDLPALERIQLFDSQAEHVHIPDNLRQRVQLEPTRDHWTHLDDWANWSPAG